MSDKSSSTEPSEVKNPLLAITSLLRGMLGDLGLTGALPEWKRNHIWIRLNEIDDAIHAEEKRKEVLRSHYAFVPKAEWLKEHNAWMKEAAKEYSGQPITLEHPTVEKPYATMAEWLKNANAPTATVQFIPDGDYVERLSKMLQEHPVRLLRDGIEIGQVKNARLVAKDGMAQIVGELVTAENVEMLVASFEPGNFTPSEFYQSILKENEDDKSNADDSQR